MFTVKNVLTYSIKELLSTKANFTFKKKFKFLTLFWKLNLKQSMMNTIQKDGR